MDLYGQRIIESILMYTTGNRVDGLAGLFTGEVRLSPHCTFGPRIQRFIKLWTMHLVGRY